MTEVICEIGINASGSLETAKRMIDVAVSAGCDYVKFQKRDIDLVYTKEELAAPRKSPWGETNGDQKRGLEFDLIDYHQIDLYCRERRIKWFFSVWDINSLKIALLFNNPFIKIPSALITNEELLTACKELTNKPIILSTGMSTWEIVDEAVRMVGKERIYCIMHCTSTYPSKPSELNLKCLSTMLERYSFTRIGFSNHNPGIIYMPIAVALGSEMIEFHITLDRSSYGSDQAASIEPEGVHKLMKYIRGIDEAMGDGVKKIYDSEVPILKKLRR